MNLKNRNATKKSNIKNSLFGAKLLMAYRKRIICKILIIFVFLFIIIGAMLYCAYLFYTRDIEVVGWEVNKTRRVLNYIFPDKDTSFTHVEINVCSKKKPLVLIMVCSDIQNADRRKAIRETWASKAEDFRTLVLFMLGNSSDEDINVQTIEESIQFNDIIVEDFIDTYNNLTLKSIFMLKWVHNNCMNVPFLMKVDDDTYINTLNLYNYLSLVIDRSENLQSFLVGTVQHDPSPHRIHFSKWYMPKYMYPDERYPDYIHGVAYLMSSQVAERLYNESLVNELIHLEDVFLTGICAKQLNIKPVDNELFHFYNSLENLRCDSIHTQLIALSHHVDIYHMYSLHYQLDECLKRS